MLVKDVANPAMLQVPRSPEPGTTVRDIDQVRDVLAAIEGPERPGGHFHSIREPPTRRARKTDRWRNRETAAAGDRDHLALGPIR